MLSIALALHPSAVGQVYNVGGGHEITINDLTVLFKQTIKSTSEIVHISYNQAYEEGFEEMSRPDS